MNSNIFTTFLHTLHTRVRPT